MNNTESKMWLDAEVIDGNVEIEDYLTRSRN